MRQFPEAFGQFSFVFPREGGLRILMVRVIFLHAAFALRNLDIIFLTFVFGSSLFVFLVSLVKYRKIGFICERASGRGLLYTVLCLDRQWIHVHVSLHRGSWKFSCFLREGARILRSFLVSGLMEVDPEVGFPGEDFCLGPSPQEHGSELGAYRPESYMLNPCQNHNHHKVQTSCIPSGVKPFV